MVGSRFVADDQRIMAVAQRYNTWLFSLAAPYLGERVFEIGAGIGNFSQQLMSDPRVKHLTTIELDQTCYDGFTAEDSRMMSIFRSDLQAIHGDFVQSELPTEPYDTVVCFNVLEHIEDDVRAVQRAYELLVPGGSLVLFVPAFNFVRGAIDDRLGHHRRYSKGSVRGLMHRAGFRVLSIRYYNLIGFVGWLLNFRLLRRRYQSPRSVMFFDRYILPLQSVLERHTPWQPFGQSLYLVAVKPSN